MRLYKSFIKNNIITLIGQVLIYAKGIILLPILIKNLGTSLYGTYVLIIIGIGFIFGISSFGVGFKFRRFIPSTEDAREKRNLFYPQLYFKLTSVFIISILLIVSSKFIKSAFFEGSYDFSMFIVAFILIFSVLYSESVDFFRYTHRILHFNIGTVCQPYLMILFIALGIYIFHIKIINFLLLSYLFALILVAVPFLVKIWKEIGFEFSTFRTKNIIEDMCLGFPLILFYIVDTILRVSDRYVIATLLSTKAVGFYSPAYTLGSLIIMMPKVFGVVLLPLLSFASDKGKENEFKNIVDYSIKFFLLISIPFIVGSYFLSKPLLELLANKEVANAAYLAVPIISMGILFYGLNLILGHILFVKMKTKVLFSVNALAAILNLILNITFIYIFRSILVAAVTTLVSYLVSFIIMNIKIKKYLKVSYNFRVIYKCILSSGIMAIALYFLKTYFGTNIGSILLTIFAGIILYLLLLFALKTFSIKEINYIKSLISAKK